MTEIELATDEMIGLFRLSATLLHAMDEGMTIDGIVFSIEDGSFNVKLVGLRE